MITENEKIWNQFEFGHPLTVESFPDVSVMAPLCLFLTPLLPSIGNDTIVKAMGTYKLQGDFPIVSLYNTEIWHPIKVFSNLRNSRLYI